MSEGIHNRTRKGARSARYSEAALLWLGMKRFLLRFIFGDQEGNAVEGFLIVHRPRQTPTMLDLAVELGALVAHEIHDPDCDTSGGAP